MSNDKKDIIYTGEDIEKYFSGRLSPARMHEMEKAALDDPFLAEAMEGYEGVRDKDWKGTLAVLRSQVAEAGSEAKLIPMHRSSGRWWKTAAAVLIIGSVTTFLLTRNKTEEKASLPIAQNVTTVQDSNTANNELLVSPGTKPVQSPVTTAEETKEPTNTTLAQVEPQKTGNDIIVSKAESKPVMDTIKASEIVSSNAGKTNQLPSVTASVPAANNNSVLADDAAKDKKLSERNKEMDAFVKQSAPAQGRKDQQVNNYFNAQVVASDNSPLPFTNISIKNENFGTYADVKGNFRLVSADTALAIEVRSVGYQPRTFLLKSNQPVNKIVLQEDEVALNEKTIIKSNEVSKNQKSRRATLLIDTVINVEPADGWDNYNTYVANNLEIPEDRKEFHGEVEITFDVKANGSISNIRVDKSLDPAYAEVAKRLIEQGPQWKVKKGRKTSAKVKVKF